MNGLLNEFSHLVLKVCSLGSLQFIQLLLPSPEWVVLSFNEKPTE